MTRPFYGRHADAYDLLITDPVEPWVDAVHDRLGRPGAAILDAGCGTGRHAAALIGKGHRVDLADASPELLSQARARCPGARALLVDLCTMPAAPEYDAVTCRGVLNDMTTDADRESAVASLVACLRPGGLLFLDVREAAASRARAGGGRSIVAGDLTFVTRTRWQDGLIHVEERYETPGQVTTYDFTMRPWTRDELLSVLRRNGMGDVEIRDGVGRRTADRLFVVAELSR
ncbi:class I SAM-dependent methyltransferase [Actinoplanes couchii]|uniref:Methyltransferase domain-containing protein n=1 Tax=Actinoplanes couchii TaxID=403638 RepID=A0ABQ3X841_9ACTN|nr:class I SAM-dependent methyltransferase [Actinoplanes couchii]MDR6320305.1 SAM-dependent methyltransferase [Actinoplanes couchii]GID54681.1 hypothetical protein Aco03nite_030850 [Actinoplanes couchii]